VRAALPVHACRHGRSRGAVPTRERGQPRHNAAVGGSNLYLVGGAPRVGKSSPAQRLLETDRIPFLPTDVLRTVLRRVLPQLDAIDQDPVDAALLTEFMYPHIEQAAEVCAEEAERFLIEGFELSPSYVARLQPALGQTEVRGCFLGHGSFSVEDLAGYRGPSRSTVAPPARSSTRSPPGSDDGAASCGRSAELLGCPMWTWASWALRAPCSKPGACCLGTVESLGWARAEPQAGRLARSTP
jgi:hypothetical protein